MVAELKHAIAKLEMLSEKDQKLMAQMILDEISWDQNLTDSSERLSDLAQEALEDYKSGKTKPLEF